MQIIFGDYKAHVKLLLLVINHLRNYISKNNFCQNYIKLSFSHLQNIIFIGE